MFEVVELITCVDPDKIGELSIPGFLHMATLEEEDTTMTYAAHVLEVATASIARQAAKYGQSFANACYRRWYGDEYSIIQSYRRSVRSGGK